MTAPSRTTLSTTITEQQIRERVERGYAGKQPDTDQIPQGGPSDNGPMTSPEDPEEIEREQDVREDLEHADDTGKRRDNAQLPPNPD